MVYKAVDFLRKLPAMQSKTAPNARLFRKVRALLAMVGLSAGVLLSCALASGGAQAQNIAKPASR
jgi:hypothetical protein